MQERPATLPGNIIAHRGAKSYVFYKKSFEKAILRLWLPQAKKSGSRFFNSCGRKETASLIDAGQMTRF